MKLPQQTIKPHNSLKNHQKKPLFLILFGLLLNIFSIHSQTQNSDIASYNWFDKTVGKSNLEINNGPFFSNSFKTTGDNNLYLVNDKYIVGNLTYNGQIYYEVKLNYDIFRDILVLNSTESELVGISLNQEKVDSFTIYNKNFVKLNSDKYQLPEFKTGYYETSPFENNIILYIKHHKKVGYKILKEDGVYFAFENDDTYYLDYKKVLYEINGKSDIVKIFPDQKKRISEYYSKYKEIRKADLNEFMKNLVKSIIPSDYNSTIK